MELSVENLKQFLPKRYHVHITEDFVKTLSQSCKDETVRDAFVENFISYTTVIKDTRTSLKRYLNAVKYVTYKLLGYSAVEAYKTTFPDNAEKYQGKEIYAYATAYNRTKLVNDIFQQTMVPTYVLNAPLHQRALSILGKMIEDPTVRGMAKVKACEAILQYTKQPDEIKNKIELTVEGGGDTIAELRDVTAKLAATMRENLEKGNTTLTDIAESKIVDVEYSEVEKDDKMLPLGARNEQD